MVSWWKCGRQGRDASMQKIMLIRIGVPLPLQIFGKFPFNRCFLAHFKINAKLIDSLFNCNMFYIYWRTFVSLILLIGSHMFSIEKEKSTSIDFSDLDLSDLDFGAVDVLQTSGQMDLPETGASCCSCCSTCCCSLLV